MIVDTADFVRESCQKRIAVRFRVLSLGESPMDLYADGRLLFPHLTPMAASHRVRCLPGVMRLEAFPAGDTAFPVWDKTAYFREGDSMTLLADETGLEQLDEPLCPILAEKGYLRLINRAKHLPPCDLVQKNGTVVYQNIDKISVSSYQSARIGNYHMALRRKDEECLVFSVPPIRIKESETVALYLLGEDIRHLTAFWLSERNLVTG